MGEIQHNMIFKLVKEERTITNITKYIRENIVNLSVMTKWQVS